MPKLSTLFDGWNITGDSVTNQVVVFSVFGDKPTFYECLGGIRRRCTNRVLQVQLLATHRTTQAIDELGIHWYVGSELDAVFAPPEFEHH